MLSCCSPTSLGSTRSFRKAATISPTRANPPTAGARMPATSSQPQQSEQAIITAKTKTCQGGAQGANVSTNSQASNGRTSPGRHLAPSKSFRTPKLGWRVWLLRRWRCCFVGSHRLAAPALNGVYLLDVGETSRSSAASACQRREASGLGLGSHWVVQYLTTSSATRAHKGSIVVLLNCLHLHLPANLPALAKK